MDWLTCLCMLFQHLNELGNIRKYQRTLCTRVANVGLTCFVLCGIIVLALIAGEC
jgi:hypothetical protein